MEQRTQRFVSIYNEINKDSLEKLALIYTDDVYFKDPMHELSGLKALTRYFETLYENVSDIEFQVNKSFDKGDVSFIYWQMSFVHPRLNKGKPTLVDGHSRLSFVGDKVSHHRDYLDTAQMLYRQVPVLGWFIKLLDKRMSA